MPIPPLTVRTEAWLMLERADAKSLRAGETTKSEANNQLFMRDDLLSSERWKIQVTYDGNSMTMRFVRKG